MGFIGNFLNYFKVGKVGKVGDFTVGASESGIKISNDFNRLLSGNIRTFRVPLIATMNCSDGITNVQIKWSLGKDGNGMNTAHHNRACSKIIVKPSDVSLMQMNIINASDILKHYGEQERNFKNLDLSRVDLSRVDLNGVDFGHSNLNRADLSYTNLSGTSLIWTDLNRANLRQANLTQSCQSHFCLFTEC